MANHATIALEAAVSGGVAGMLATFLLIGLAVRAEFRNDRASGVASATPVSYGDAVFDEHVSSALRLITGDQA